MKVTIDGPRFDMWIDALVSGQYQQTRGQLYRNDTKGFCCLGVACDVLNAMGDGAWTQCPDGDYTFDGSFAHLTASALKVLFPKYELEAGAVESLVSRLMRLNDVEMSTFEEIARYIDDNTERVY